MDVDQKLQTVAHALTCPSCLVPVRGDGISLYLVPLDEWDLCHAGRAIGADFDAEKPTRPAERVINFNVSPA